MKYPIGVQTFANIINDGFVYVDKTDLVYRLAHEGRYIFLSRPRRFGKSLLLSTLDAYFSGKMHLFEGLAIDKLETEWLEHAVIRIDLNTGEYDSVEGLISELKFQLHENEQKLGIVPTDSDLANRFSTLIKRAKELSGRNVVVLIDEYDKPLLEAIGKPELQEQLRDKLRPFYSVLKSCDEHIRFAMLTGVTKFGHLSVFSGLNNLNDITFNRNYASICGITKEEIHRYFSDPLELMAKEYECSLDQMVEELRRMYDGYRFSMADVKVFNPFSLLNAFFREDLGAYWFGTGTPKYLVDLLQKNYYNLWELDGVAVDENQLSSFNPDDDDPIPVMYQSGYLSIKDYDKIDRLYMLGYPNEEVRKGFMEYLIPFYLEKNRRNERFDINKFRREIMHGEAEAFMRRVKSLSADISYEILASCEDDFQNMMYIIFTMCSVKPQVERCTSDGRIDMVVETAQFVYIMEFKIDSTAQEAIEQINSKDYALPWTADHRRVIKIGANFSTSTRRLTDYIIEQ